MGRIGGSYLTSEGSNFHPCVMGKLGLVLLGFLGGDGWRTFDVGRSRMGSGLLGQKDYAVRDPGGCAPTRKKSLHRLSALTGIFPF